MIVPLVAGATGPGWIPARATSTGELGVPQISFDPVVEYDLKDGVVLKLRLLSTTPEVAEGLPVNRVPSAMNIWPVARCCCGFVRIFAPYTGSIRIDIFNQCVYFIIYVD